MAIASLDCARVFLKQAREFISPSTVVNCGVFLLDLIIRICSTVRSYASSSGSNRLRALISRYNYATN